jgi:hypothetical protein
VRRGESPPRDGDREEKAVRGDRLDDGGEREDDRRSQENVVDLFVDARG